MKKEEFGGPAAGKEGQTGAEEVSSSFVLRSPFIYYLGLGTNLGDKEQNLRMAVREIEERVGQVTALSAFYVTEPWGFSSDNGFLNAACGVKTSLSPFEVLALTQEIERTMGRTCKSEGGVYHDRIIDIDLLLCLDASGSQVCVDTPQLKLPHPLMHLRDFVMKPLLEIMPGAAGLIRPNAE